ncbi:hypothetical protein AVEN_136745-1 [Araneus ventricosus]|uniref:Uncharacterized protein n=1 Tax=Araneus ventricosus TaxID=182803 RepID=A0A4Y2GIR6_ARAVE|nr:hypothetical protein AVEN_29752-1 [Araneus ventricosus]GBM52824.1 hypothetical protein AVEN_136745-1 [Araneus ventricosus]
MFCDRKWREIASKTAGDNGFPSRKCFDETILPQSASVFPNFSIRSQFRECVFAGALPWNGRRIPIRKNGTSIYMEMRNTSANITQLGQDVVTQCCVNIRHRCFNPDKNTCKSCESF